MLKVGLQTCLLDGLLHEWGRRWTIGVELAAVALSRRGGADANAPESPGTLCREIGIFILRFQMLQIVPKSKSKSTNSELYGSRIGRFEQWIRFPDEKVYADPLEALGTPGEPQKCFCWGPGVGVGG